jgi:HAD superfamily phosphatase (TIGR01668 family)
MLRKLIPSEVVANVRSIDYAAKYKAGFRQLMFDLDNTLTTYQHSAPTPELVDFIQELQAIGFEVSIVSNSTRKRVDPFLQALGVRGRASCKKPSAKALREMLHVDKESVIVIGDQLLTDIWAANNLGVRSVLVHPVDITTDRFFTTMNRKVERYAVKKIRQKHPAVYDQRLKSRYE